MKLNPRLLRESRQSRTIFILSISLSLIGGILGILQAREISSLISQVFLQGKDLEAVSRLLLFIFIIIVLRVGAVWGGELSASAGASKIKQALRQRLYSHLTDIGPAYLRSEAGEQDTRTGELTNLIIEGIEALDAYYSQYLPQVALSALIPLAILIVVIPTDLLSGIILLVTAPLLPLFMYLIGNAVESLTRKQWRGLSRMSAYFLDVLQGLTTLKYLGRSREQVDVIKRVSEQYRQSTMGVLKVTFLSALVLELIATLSTAVVAVEIGLRLLYGKMAFEQAFFVLLLAPEFYLPLRLLGMRFHAGMAGVEASKRIYEILDLPAITDNTIYSPSVSGVVEPQIVAEGMPPSIEFKDVSYAYSNHHPALLDLSFKIPAGKMTAIVGESGAGKTTLTWLLLRFLQPECGEIFVNGKLLSEISVQQWRNNLAWVPQNPYLFNDTIAANIKLARPDASDAKIQQAAHLAHVDEFIDQLPQGYHTLIGERGTRLSAGQAQRIALARAFLKDAPLLILDEATSHLDPEMDAQLQEVLRRLTQDRTVLVIAHHRSTLLGAHQVIKLSHGRVVRIQSIEASTKSNQSESSLILQQGYPSDLPNFSGERGEPLQLNKKEKHRPSADKRLFKLLSPFTGRILLSILLGFATIASGVGLMATAAYIISAAALQPSIAELQVAIVGVRFFGLSRGVFRYLERLVSHDVTFRLLASWRVWFYQALEPLAPARLMQYHSGDLLSRVIGDIGTLENFYVRAISPPLVALLVALSIGLFMGAFSAELAWVLMVFLAFAGLGLPLITYLISHQLGPQIIQRRAQLSTEIIDGIQGLPDILTCCQAGAQIKRVGQAGEHLTLLQKRMAGITVMQNALGSLLASLGMLAVLALSIQRVAEGKLDGVLIGMLALAAFTSFEAMLPLPLAAQNYEVNQAAARRLYDLVDAKPAVNDPAEPLMLPDFTNLDIHQLSFQYPVWVDENPTAEVAKFSLQNISFTLSQGKHIALVGPSGAGKTTLINLLLRFWEYQQGSIHLNGNELHDYRQEEIRKRIAIISQNTYLFSATIKENLLIAHPEASDDEIIQATKTAQLHEMIQSLPDGYNTWIGEHGLRLSAGERQRLAIARAMLKDTPLLLLDEPTANLDPVTELAVLSSIREISQGRSTISITQHMVGLETMDEILVFKQGQVIEQGSHNELSAKKGYYWLMWELYNQII
jgi:ATP-binding cassette subfamily C protein CydCD